MTVEEMIEELQRYPHHAEVAVMFWWPDADGLHGNEIPCRPVIEFVGPRVEISASQEDL